MIYTSILKFETRNKNQYIFDGNTSNVIPVDDTILRTIDLFSDEIDNKTAIATLKKEGYDESKIQNAVAVVCKYKRLGYFYKDSDCETEQRKFQWDFDDNCISALHNYGNLFQLVLNVTEDCNLRCKYCYLSEIYDFSRNRTSCNMTFDTAKKAVDYFLKKIREVSKFNPAKKAAITFYGGEPLLNFTLVQDVVAYVEENYSDIDLNFNLTTNGILLSEDKADYLVKKGFIISVSIDGNQENNDRNRVFPDGSGSFNVVYKNLVAFKRKYPDYAFIKLLVVQEFNTNIEANLDFFVENQGVIPDVAMVSFVTSTNTHYFDNLDGEIVNNYVAQFNSMIQKFLNMTISEQPINSYLNMLFSAGVYSTIGRARIEDQKAPMLPFTGSCVPGMKISVRTDGTYDICERVNGTMPIGSIEKGLDIAAISNVIRQYNTEVTSKCFKCPISRVCTVCFANCNGCGKFNSPDCSNQIQTLILNLSILYSILEENPSLKDKFSLNKLNQIEWLLNN